MLALGSQYSDDGRCLAQFIDKPITDCILYHSLNRRRPLQKNNTRRLERPSPKAVSLSAIFQPVFCLPHLFQTALFDSSLLRASRFVSRMRDWHKASSNGEKITHIEELAEDEIVIAIDESVIGGNREAGRKLFTAF